MARNLRVAVAILSVVTLCLLALLLYVRASISHLGFLTPADVKRLIGAANAASTTLPNGPQEPTGPTVEVPPFAIAIKLSSNAEQRLRKLGEGMKILAMFDGDPLPGQGKYNPPMRDVYLGSAEQFVDETNIVRFDHVRVPQKDFDRLADKDFFVTINTFTARRVARDNLLDCAEPISVRIDTLKGKTTEVRCWLIGESDAPTE